MRAVIGMMLVALAANTVLAQSTPPAADLAARIQTHYGAVKDFTATFTLEQTSLLRPKVPTERGTVKIKKPSRMRWAWTTGGKQEYIADGVRLYSYFPEDKYCTEMPLPKGDEGGTALLFLTGRADLTKDFVASLPAKQPEGEWQVIFTPKTPQTEFKTLTLQVDRASWQLRGFIVVDDQGGTANYRFAGMRENQTPPDSDFYFSPPKGVEIRR